MAKKQTRSDASTFNWDDVLDVDGNMTAPMEDQIMLLPDNWDPSTDTNGSDFPTELVPNGVAATSEPVEYGWNAKLNRWIDTPPGY